jgi:hypothetical protein
MNQASEILSPRSGQSHVSISRSPSLNEDKCMRWCSCRCHRSFYMRSPQLLSSAFGNFYVRCTGKQSSCNETTCKRRSKSTTAIAYRFPGWLTSSAIHFTLVSSALSTQSKLTSLRVVPNSSAIFGAVSAGDLSGVQKLFQEGRASIYDVDERNWTLLHVRVQSLLRLASAG